MSSLESTLFQWRRGEERLAQAPANRRALLERVTEAVVAELRRRLGGRFSSGELADLYGNGTAWCLEVAMGIAPEDPWAWDSSVIADAAFGRYLHEAADYSGGKLRRQE